MASGTAVDHIDLTVPRGSFFGLVGLNGAGKTTSLAMAVWLLKPDGGSARGLPVGLAGCRLARWGSPEAVSERRARGWAGDPDT